MIKEEREFLVARSACRKRAGRETSSCVLRLRFLFACLESASLVTELARINDSDSRRDSRRLDIKIRRLCNPDKGDRIGSPIDTTRVNSEAHASDPRARKGVRIKTSRRPRARDVFINQPAYDNLILSLVVTITTARRFGGKGRKKAARWASERGGAGTQAALNSAPSRARARARAGTPSSMSVSLLNLLLESLGSRVRKHPFQLPTASFGAAFYRLRARLAQGYDTLVSSADEFRGSREPGKLSKRPRSEDFKDAGIRESEGSGSRASEIPGAKVRVGPAMTLRLELEAGTRI